MMLVETPRTLTTETMADDVESLLNPVEAEGTFRDSAECGGVVLLAGLLLASPPTPRPKKG